MRCLYCGKELALLKRLTRGGEFCSEAHKQSYQEEYNRLGLSRLLQARSKAGESTPAPKPAATPVAPVAVAERPVKKIAVEKAAPPPAPPAVIVASPEPPPPAIAGFVLEQPSILVPPEPVSYLEPWIWDEDPETTSTPPTPAWHLESPTGEHPFFTLASAELVPLELQPDVCESSFSVMDTNVTAKEFGHPRVNLSLPLTVRSSHEFQQGGSIAIEIAPRPSESSCYASLNGAIDFSSTVGVQSFELLELAPAGIAYTDEDCDVTISESWTNGIISEAPVDFTVPAIPQDPPVPELPAEPVVARTPEATPRAALEALSRLHQDMREREEATPAAPAAAEAAEATEEASGGATEEATEAAPKSAAEPAHSSPSEPSPREASELLAISLKSFAPPKAAPVINANALLTSGHPLLPRLKALPLRPKVAPAPRGFSQPAKTAPAQRPPAEPKAKAEQSSAPPSAEVRQKAPVAGKPAQLVQTPKPAQTAEPAKPAQSPQAQPPQVKKPAQPVEAAKAKPPAPAAQTTPPIQSPAQPSPTAKPAKPEQPAKAVPAEPPRKSVQPAPKAQPIQPPKAEPVAVAAASTPAKREPVQKTPPVKDEPARKAAPVVSAPAVSAPAVSAPPVSAPAVSERVAPVHAAPAPAASSDNSVPNFGAVVNTSMFGSLNVKLGIAALAVVFAVGAYFGFAGKSKPAAYPIKASDGIGPSIMVGEGGWVEGWAGDPVGLHNARQITVYRPSLKLADYRFEFQGQIDTKSIGWIFRAADPENYYAMKLELVSQELPLKVALYKYLVLKGRQVQAGRVPIDVPVKNDTVFSIRLDIRGPKFNTYVQGQPVDVWTDDQLRSGGVGFLNERSERGKVKSVSLSYLSGGTK